jgi:hypothetical protein
VIQAQVGGKTNVVNKAEQTEKKLNIGLDQEVRETQEAEADEPQQVDQAKRFIDLSQYVHTIQSSKENENEQLISEKPSLTYKKPIQIQKITSLGKIKHKVVRSLIGRRPHRFSFRTTVRPQGVYNLYPKKM